MPKEPSNPLKKPFALRGLHSFFVGGENQYLDLPDTGGVALALGAPEKPLQQRGDYQVNQMYVQGFLAGEEDERPPVLMWHGGGMTGATWESTPDGRPGWLELALRDGLDVYISDAVERGRSAPPPNAILQEPAIFRSKELAWKIFRMGPEAGYSTDATDRDAYPNHQFPLDHFDSLANQFVARWPALTPIVRSTYSKYLQSFEQATLIAHSQGCGFAQELAPSHADHLNALILIEPSGAPANVTAEQLKDLSDVPHLVVWGDFFEASQTWKAYRQTTETYLDRLRQADVRVDVIDLPAMGINGNGHCPMMERNNQEIWRLVSDWCHSL